MQAVNAVRQRDVVARPAFLVNEALRLRELLLQEALVDGRQLGADGSKLCRDLLALLLDGADHAPEQVPNDGKQTRRERAERGYRPERYFHHSGSLFARETVDEFPEKIAVVAVDGTVEERVRARARGVDLVRLRVVVTVGHDDGQLLVGEARA